MIRAAAGRGRWAAARDTGENTKRVCGVARERIVCDESDDTAPRTPGPLPGGSRGAFRLPRFPPPLSLTHRVRHYTLLY